MSAHLTLWRVRSVNKVAAKAWSRGRERAQCAKVDCEIERIEVGKESWKVGMEEMRVRGREQNASEGVQQRIHCSS